MASSVFSRLNRAWVWVRLFIPTIMDFIAGAAILAVSILMALGIKAVPSVVEDAVVDDYFGGVWVALMLISSLMFTVAILLRHFKPYLSYTLEEASCIPTGGLAFIYGISATVSFGFITGCLTLAVSLVALLYFARRWFDLESPQENADRVVASSREG